MTLLIIIIYGCDLLLLKLMIVLSYIRRIIIRCIDYNKTSYH